MPLFTESRKQNRRDLTKTFSSIKFHFMCSDNANLYRMPQRLDMNQRGKNA